MTVETEDQTVRDLSCLPLRVTNGGLTNNTSYYSLNVGSGLTGSGTANQIAYWSGTSALAGDAGMTYDAALDSLSLIGDLTILGNNITATTNTDRMVFMANGTTYAPEVINLGTDTTGSYAGSSSEGGNATTANTGDSATGFFPAGSLDVSRGGVGPITWAQGDILYALDASNLATLNKSALATRYVSNTGATNDPAWAQVNLANGVTGVLPVSNAGTGAAPGADDQLLVSDSTSAATWRTLTICTGAGKAVTYDTATNTFGCNTITGGGITGLTADSGGTTTGTTVTLTGGSGITTTRSTDVITLAFAPTEISSFTWGAGSFTTETYDAGAVDPAWTAASGSLTLTTGDLGIAANAKFNLEGSAGDTYFTYNSTSGTVQLYVNGVLTWEY